MKPKFHCRRVSFMPAHIATGLAAAVMISTASASAITWTGATPGTWGTNTNWDMSAVPTLADDLTILGPGNAAGALDIDIAAAATANSISFTNTDTSIFTNTASGANQTLTLGTTGITTGTGAVTIGSATTNQAVNIALGATQIWNTGAGGLTVNNAISGTTFGITKTGAGTLTLAGANTYTGATAINNGTLELQASAIDSFRTSTTIASGATLKVTSTAATTYVGGNYVGRAINQSSSLVMTIGGSGTLAITGQVGIGNANAAQDIGIGMGAGGLIDIQANALLVNGGWQGATWTNNLASMNIASGAAFDIWDGNAVTIDALNGSGTIRNGSNNTGGRSLTIGVANGSGTFSGNISATKISGGSNGGSGKISITKTGVGTQTLSGANSYTGGTTIGAGILKIGSATALGASSGAVSLNAGAVLDLGGQTYSNTNALTIRGTGISGGGALINGSSTAASYAGLLTLGSASSIIASVGDISLGNAGTITGATFGLTLGGAYNTTISSLIGTSTGTLTKQDAGKLTLSGANTYTGATSVTGGTLVLTSTGAINTSSAITVNGSGAKFVDTSSVAVSPTVTLTQGTVDGTGTINTVNVTNLAGNTVQNGNGTATGTLAIGALTFSGVGTLNVFMVGTIKGIGVTGALITANTGTGLITVNASSNSGWISGTTYDLLTFGSITGGFSDFTKGTISGLGARQTAALGLSATAIQLTISGATPLWTGAASGVWSTTAVGAPQNWKLDTDSSPAEFLTNDVVLFDDTATGTTDVTINDATVNPASATFNNSSKTYTLSGTNGINSGSLTKSGTGSLVVTNSNSHTGPTAINSGRINIQNSGALGATSGVTVASGAALELQGGISVGNLPLNISGAGLAAAPAGAMCNVSGTNSYAGLLTLGANVAIQSDADSLALSNVGTITGSGFNLTLAGAGNGSITSIIGTGGGMLAKNGSGTWTLSGNNTYTGATVINNGTLELQSGAIDSFRSSTTIASGATLKVTSTAATTYVGGNYVGRALNQSTTGSISISGTGTLAITGQVGLGNANAAQDVSIAMGAGGLIDIQAGGMLVNGGWQGGTWGSNLGSMNIAGGAVFDIWDGNAVTIDALTGSGTLRNGSVNAVIRQLTIGAANGSGTFSGKIDATALPSGSGQGGGVNGAAGKISLIKTGTGTQVLSGNNTYTGTTTIKAGTLQIGDGTDAGSIATSSGIINNGALVYNVGPGTRTYSNVISGTGSLTQNSAGGTLALTGTNTYTGDTTVSAGILAVGGNAIADTNKLVISGGKVAPTGTEVVNSLYFDASQQASGTWGATGSGATHIDDTHFSGAGVVRVTSGPGYANWAAAEGLTVGVNDGANQDPDGDGISNLLEYVLGGHPIGAGASDTSILPTQTLDATDLTLTFHRSDLSELDTVQTIQISTGLGTWADFATLGATSSGAVTVTEDSPTAELDTVSVAIPRSNAVDGKLFARLNVIKN